MKALGVFMHTATIEIKPRTSEPTQVGQAGGNLYEAKNNDDLSCFNCTKLFSKAREIIFGKATLFTGTREGYFLPYNDSGWVRGYCRTCWETEVLAMLFIRKKIDSETNVKNQEIIQLSTKITELTSTLTIKDEESINFQELNNHLKDKITTNEQLLQEKDKEIEELKNKIKDIPPSYGMVDTLKSILSVLDEEQINVFKMNKLDAESIKEHIQNEIAMIVRFLLQAKISLLSQLFDKLIILSEINIQQLENAQQYIVNGLGDTSDLFTQEDLSETLKPIQKKKAKQEALKERWITLKEEVFILNNVNNETI